ncbi:DNA starvation/stationary phase protection protein Dps [Corynebacterium halotolerans]|uniref:DNA-binding protein n=1 Tax=Corynebacterium halotolerans YIM 70093 = DSM 44683 TaxID=1121362 RepID=M1P3Q4_9CORY|nr:DNA starvation/stationary phase protection protein Dps [Corynebacterium halotolerans]AGF71311.1 DNA-binding protein [Corynebacterium halotolerans YIM 70093 = DSM 44683]
MSNYTVPGLSDVDSKKLIDELQARLNDYNDLHLILKHAHWNVVGQNFIAVHEMLDPQVDLVRGYADEVAERVSTLGGEPLGTPDAQANDRTPLKYEVNKGGTQEHLAAIDKLYVDVVERVRESLRVSGELDPVTEDIFISHAAELEKFQWFVRAHLDTAN